MSAVQLVCLLALCWLMLIMLAHIHEMYLLCSLKLSPVLPGLAYVQIDAFTELTKHTNPIPSQLM